MLSCILIIASVSSAQNALKHHFFRFLRVSDEISRTEEVLQICEKLHESLHFDHFVVRPMRARAKPHCRPVEFKNICGKIQHTKLCSIFEDHVSPYLQSISNSFGTFLCLSSIECNFSMCESRNYTLFRAARKSSEISDKICLALKTECIMSVFVHMIVCSAHLSHPVYCKHKCLLNRLEKSQLFEVSDHDQLTESYSSICLKITNFDKCFLEKYLQEIDFPKQIFITVGRFGSINMFVSLPKHTVFDNRLELRFVPFCQALVNIIEDMT